MNKTVSTLGLVLLFSVIFAFSSEVITQASTSGIFNGTFYNATNSSIQINTTVGLSATHITQVQNLSSNGSIQTLNNISWVNQTPVGTNISVSVRTLNSSNESGLQGYWRLDGNLPIDYSGNGNNIESSTAVLNQSCLYDGCYEFDGTTRLVGNSFNISNQITISAWAKRSRDVNAFEGIAAKWTGSGNIRSFGLFVENSGEWAFHLSSDGTENVNVVSNSQATNDGWHHILGTYDGTNMFLFIDGINQTDTDTISGIKNSNRQFMIGDFQDGFLFFGSIDEVKVYNRTLSAEEILVLNSTPPTDWTQYTERNFSNPNIFTDNEINGTHVQTKFYFETNNIAITPSLFNYTYSFNSTNIITPEPEASLNLTIIFNESVPLNGANITSSNVTIKINSNKNLSNCTLSRTDTLPLGETFFNITGNNTLIDLWDLRYPVTYIFDIPQNSNEFSVSKRYSESKSWIELNTLVHTDIYNGIEGVRFNFSINKAYISVGFNETENIFLKIGSIGANYNSTANYYDDRKMAFSLSNDNWGQDGDSADAGVDCNDNFKNDSCDKYQAAVLLARSFNMPITIAINTRLEMNSSTYALIQEEINKGGFEPASHSRTHPSSDAQYRVNGYDFEINGSKIDLLNNLTGFNYTDTILTYILPSGVSNDNITANVSGNYLFQRQWVSGDTKTFLDYPDFNDTFQLYSGGWAYTSWDSDFQSTALDGNFSQARFNEQRDDFDTVYDAGGIMFEMYHSDR